jgi:MOSC domain-containing protein YiiM
MWKGKLLHICISPGAGQSMQAVQSIRALAGVGLEGDRYASRQGTYSTNDDGSRQVTLIEIEALEALEGETGVRLSPLDARRNLITRGAPLNSLVGKTFQVGEVALRGIRLCEPCQHLADLTQADVLPGLANQGGLRAEIINEGIIRVGDPITEGAG